MRMGSFSVQARYECDSTQDFDARSFKKVPRLPEMGMPLERGLHDLRLRLHRQAFASRV